VQAISLQPILYKQKPNLQAASAKLDSFLAERKVPQSSRDVLKKSLVGWIETYNNGYPHPPPAAELSKWRTISKSTTDLLDVDKLFPLIDFWRMIVLDARIGSHLAVQTQPFEAFLEKVRLSLDGPPSGSGNPRNTYVTLLRLLSNAFVSPELAYTLLGSQLRQSVTTVVVPCLLHSDSAVRSAAAGVAFNAAAYYQAARVKYHRDGKRGDPAPETLGDEDWEMELITALLEALSQETDSEEVGESVV
jgi:hypothetical protein